MTSTRFQSSPMPGIGCSLRSTDSQKSFRPKRLRRSPVGLALVDPDSYLSILRPDEEPEEAPQPVVEAEVVPEPEVPPLGEWLEEVSPGWSWHWRHLVLARKKLEEVEAGKLKRLIITMPPQHGKTELISVRSPVWRLKRNPKLRVILGAYNQRYANKLSRKALRIARRELHLNPYRRAVEEWELEEGGSFVAVGVGSGVTGNPGDLLHVDDPIKGREEADSEVYREKVWEWYTEELRTRLQPNGAIVIVMCMTGDTPVLMEDGSERPLRDIRPGDRVATYEAGKVSASTVRNWCNNGPDSVYEIRMKSGITVKANARHPFLVEEGGEAKWRRTATLKKGSIILRVTGESGRALHARQKNAASQPSAEACATTTTANLAGMLAFGRLLSTLSLGAKRVCAIATELASQSMRGFLPSRVEFVPSVSSHPRRRTLAPIGTASFASTIATIVTVLGGFFATTAIWRLVTERLRRFCSPPLNTYEIARDEVVEVVPAGVEDVFDVEIERTENFIANGLVSHNTRWHEDDLVGRILASEDAAAWTVVDLPAFAEDQADRDAWAAENHRPTGQLDLLGREPGEALCPERYDRAALEELERDMGFSFHALYQGRPRPRAGKMFDRHKFRIVKAWEWQGATLIRYWDKAGTEGGGANTAGGLMARMKSRRYIILDVVKAQLAAGNREELIKQTAELDAMAHGKVEVWVEQEPGSGGKESAESTVLNLAGFVVKLDKVTGDKVIRAEPFAAQVNAGNVDLLAGPWNAAFLAEAETFPRKKKDQIDACAGAFNKLSLGFKSWVRTG
jgi:predicted phage terminase large subunit-like protein